jgi:hypothetical protein
VSEVAKNQVEMLEKRKLDQNIELVQDPEANDKIPFLHAFAVENFGNLCITIKIHLLLLNHAWLYIPT